MNEYISVCTILCKTLTKLILKKSKILFHVKLIKIINKSKISKYYSIPLIKIKSVNIIPCKNKVIRSLDKISHTIKLRKL